MSLTPATRLGPYEIVAPLGAGGMGDVYLARDTRLDRRVALKLLPSRLNRDTQAIFGFRREAFTLAALNHPNIAIIHGFEELPGGTTALVMELVEGETLQARLARGPMAIEEAMQICAQVAEALEVAHEHGIVHRDLKPGNVMIGPRGLVKVLDFGLARRIRGIDGFGGVRTPGVPAPQPTEDGDASPPGLDPEDAPTIAMAKTSSGPGGAAPTPETHSLEGMTVGTPGYMSPEQVRAQPADARSDVFAIACLLYECLTGRRAFKGETMIDTMRATLFAPVDFEPLPRAVPARIRTLLAHSLEKDPDARPANMRFVRVELEEALGIRRAAALREGTPYATPNNLPAQTTSFVGREDVLRECERLMEETRLLTLLGMGGSGKTRVAQCVAETSLARYPDGVWFVNLASVADDVHVTEVAAAALQVQDEPGCSALEALVHRVRDLRMLFVVDNCEHVLDGARRLVTGILAGCARSSVLTTSREPLAIEGERVFPLPTLATPGEAAELATLMSFESVALFVERARATQPDFGLTPEHAPDVVEICRRLDGIPLALELAAARVRLLGVGQIRARLGDRFKLLARAGGGPSRQQTVLATIQWSWDHLLPPEHDLMRRLAVFTGGWTLERATAVVSDGGDEFEVLDLLTRLVERSLVVVERPTATTTRYRFLESVHHFALERLHAHPDSVLMRERHLETYLKLAEPASARLRGPDVMQQIAELKLEEDNILAALAWCEHAPDGARRGLILAERTYRFWSALGRYAMGRRVIEGALERDAANPPSAERAAALTRAAGLAMLVGDHASARRHLEESLAFWRSSGDPRGLPAALAGLGVVAMFQSRFEQALSFGEESLGLYEQRGDRRGVAMALHNIGSIEYALARLDYGRSRFERALALLRDAGDRSSEALCLSALASACLRRGDHEAARRAMRECLDLMAALEAPREGVYALDALADLLFTEHHSTDAARIAGAAEAARIALDLRPFPAERAELDHRYANLRAAAGPGEVEEAMAIGGTLSLAAALAEGRRILASL